MPAEPGRNLPRLADPSYQAERAVTHDRELMRGGDRGNLDDGMARVHGPGSDGSTTAGMPDDHGHVLLHEPAGVVDRRCRHLHVAGRVSNPFDGEICKL